MPSALRASGCATGGALVEAIEGLVEPQCMVVFMQLHEVAGDDVRVTDDVDLLHAVLSAKAVHTPEQTVLQWIHVRGSWSETKSKSLSLQWIHVRGSWRVTKSKRLSNCRTSMEATLAAGMVLLSLVKPTTSLKKTETFSRRTSPPHPLQLPRSRVAMLRGKLVRTYCHSTPLVSPQLPTAKR